MVSQSGMDLGGWGTSKNHNMIKHGTSWTIDTNSTENKTEPLGDGTEKSEYALHVPYLLLFYSSYFHYYFILLSHIN